MTEYKKIDIGTLKNFVIDVFTTLDVPEADAGIIADVLIASDQRGIASHGVARLHRYVNGIEDGIMQPNPNIETVKESLVTVRLDGGASLGQVVSKYAMDLAIDKAKRNNLSLVVVQNSNHFGIAGYYSMLALEENLIGIAMTNAGPLVVPTFAKDAVYGTNPISVAVPSEDEYPYVLDMATSTVPRGKLEVYHRRDKKIPTTWAINENGDVEEEPGLVLDNLKKRIGGGLLPLGGVTEENRGYKGYGLGILVDIFTGVLSGGSFGLDVYGKKGEAPDVCHMFAAVNIEAFMPVNVFKKRMDEYIKMIKSTSKIKGKSRIYIHGEKEWEKMDHQQERVAIELNVVEKMRSIADDLHVDCPF